MADFIITGQPTPVIEFETEPGEKLTCEAGAMVWKSRNIEMTTQMSGGLKGAIARATTDDSIFTNTYISHGPGLIAFASSYVGEIIQLPLTGNNSYIVQKGGFLVSIGDVRIEPYINKGISTSLFGGEGFIMQKFTGVGDAFVELGGHIREFQLGEGQAIEIQTGNLAVMESTCTMNIVEVPGMVNKFLGGEGIYNTIVRGPGKIWLQSHPPREIAVNLNVLLQKTKISDRGWV